MGGRHHEGPTMNETWKSDLERWLAPFLSAFRHKARARMCPIYVAGLIGAGDRKSVQPMAAREGNVGYDRLHHFIASGVCRPSKKQRGGQWSVVLAGAPQYMHQKYAAKTSCRFRFLTVARLFASPIGPPLFCAGNASQTKRNRNGACAAPTQYPKYHSRHAPEF
jgi:hypothetical protein